MYGELIQDPTFPPRLTGEKLSVSVEPFMKAISASMMGTNPGVVYYAEDTETLKAAIILSPEVALNESVGVTHALMLAMSDSLGALGPPELAVHFTWPFSFKINAAHCGTLKFAASTTDPEIIPDWLVVAITIPFRRPLAIEPGSMPDRTWLYEEGCIELTVPQVIESWSRHALIWLNTFEENGYAGVQDHWRAKCDSIGELVNYPQNGLFVGTNELGGLLLRQGGITNIQSLIDEMSTQ